MEKVTFDACYFQKKEVLCEGIRRLPLSMQSNSARLVKGVLRQRYSTVKRDTEF